MAQPHTPTPPSHIPYNTTSANDAQVVAFVLGPHAVEDLEVLRRRPGTGRSMRAILRAVGEVWVHRRNPYLFEALLRRPVRRRHLFRRAEADLAEVVRRAGTDPSVVALVDHCRRALRELRKDLLQTPGQRRRLRRILGRMAGPDAVRFDPFTRVAHATDASDWRLHLPVAVVLPDREASVAPLLAALADEGLNVVPRGGGTGLTGGAVPLASNTVVLNTERLNGLRGVALRNHLLPDGRVYDVAVLEAEAGVITEQAMAAAEAEGWVFATDPTSAWASTLGGNIAENAGGKACVRWGTCLDNLLDWRLALPSGRWIRIHRTDHPLRKILPGDTVTFEVRDESGATLQILSFRGGELRRPGLWKDITWKALGGLPGIQKEGTDGVITSATFLLHRAYPLTRTLCLEFFGRDLREASRVIVALSTAFPDPESGGEALLALEHFDQEYVRAIGYRTKAAIEEAPKAVLLVDLGGHAEADLERGVARIQAIVADHPSTRMTLARDHDEARAFWSDRKQLGAIARRTNAFKLNEDVVIPLQALTDFAAFIEAENAEAEREAQVGFARAAEALLAPTHPELATACAAFAQGLATAAQDDLRSLRLLEALNVRLETALTEAPELLEPVRRLEAQARDRRLVLATHMHAGDGNVHVNLPVHSSDPDMLARAHRAVDRVMAQVVALGGVVSGEHGIGVTKLKYLAPERIAELRAYRRAVDPRGVMHPGALEDPAILDRLATPSFRRMEVEARILRLGRLEALSQKVSRCIRCGKCKPACAMHHPTRGLFYHPRNKNLALGALLDALLYDAQRWRSHGFEQLAGMTEVADACTLCRRCLKPCPVDIDSGEVSLRERELLASEGLKRTPMLTRLTLRYLDTRSRPLNRLVRLALVRGGGAAQRVGVRVMRPLQRGDRPPRLYALRLLRSPMAPVPGQDLWRHLPRCRPDQALVLEPQVPPRATVLYFPGCGSERLHTTVAQAAIHLLLETGNRVILPPPHLCCGYPAHANARKDLHRRSELRDGILLSQIRQQLSHLDVQACVVTCGTCREALLSLETDRLFGGVVDVLEHLANQGLQVWAPGPWRYHAPCHDALQGRAGTVLPRMGLVTLEHVPHCCSEAGTLALSRPDLADALLHRKRRALGAGRGTVVTHCPSCLSGLGRCEGIQPRHVVEVLAEALSGSDWASAFPVITQHASRMPLF